jgi:transcriptional regulator with XRE-family HTH domain
VPTRKQSSSSPGKRRCILSLAELRSTKDISQTDVAETMEMTQGEVSRFERRSDVRVSSLTRYIEALGGHIELHARFSKTETYTLKLGGQK